VRRCRFRPARAHTVRNEQVDDVLASPLGVITWNQACAAGFTARQIESRRATREWIDVHLGVHRHASAPRNYDQRILAGVLAAGPNRAVSHRAAIVRWGLHGFGARLVELSRPTAVRRPLDGAIVHRMPDLGPYHVDVVGGVPTTSPALSSTPAW